MAEDNEKLRKQIGNTPGSIPIKGSVTKTDTEAANDKDTSVNPRVRPMKLPPKHTFRG